MRDIAKLAGTTGTVREEWVKQLLHWLHCPGALVPLQ